MTFRFMRFKSEESPADETRVDNQFLSIYANDSEDFETEFDKEILPTLLVNFVLALLGK